MTRDGSDREGAPPHALDDSDRADDEAIARVDGLIRRWHPDLHDSRGRLRKRLVFARLKARFGGLRLAREDVDELIRVGRAAAARRITREISDHR